MNNSKVHLRTQRRPMLFCLIIMMIVVAGPPVANAEDSPLKGTQTVINDCLVALWTGETDNPTFTQRQQALKAMIKNGAITRDELKNVVGKTFFYLLNRHKTTRYELKAMSQKVEALFSPLMNWQDIRKTLWGVSTSPVDENNPLLIKIGTLAPPGTPWMTLPETVIFPELEELTDGRLLFKIYGGGVLGDDAAILEKMKNHQIVDGCGCTALGVLEASPETSVLLTPGLFKSYEEVDYICKKFRKKLDQEFEKRGYILAALIDTGFLYLFSKNKITDLSELKQQTVMTWFGAQEAALYKELEVQTIPMTIPEVISALDMGQADTVLIPPVWMLGMQAYQYTNYYINPPLMYSPAAIFVNHHTRDRLQHQAGVSETYAYNLQELIVFEFNSREPEWKKQLRKYEQKSLKAFETKCGMKAITFPAEDQYKINTASKAVQQKLTGRIFPDKLINDIKKALVEYRNQN